MTTPQRKKHRRQDRYMSREDIAQLRKRRNHASVKTLPADVVSWDGGRF